MHFIELKSTVSLSAVIIFSISTFGQVSLPAAGAPLQKKDTATAISGKDTSRTEHPDSLRFDSTLMAGKSPDTMQAAKKKGAPLKSIQAIDTVSRFLTRPYFGIGVGWGLGSFPVLTDWQNTVPDSAGAILPLNPDTLGFAITEPVNTYNILFPLYFSYTPLVYGRSSIALEGSFFFIGKSIQATLRHDTLFGKINYQKSINFYGFSAGVFYRRQIGEQYFKIDNIDKASFILGLSVLPYYHLSQSETISSSGIGDSVISAANGRLLNYQAWGMGGGWRIGIGTRKSLSATSGVEVSVSYIGRYMAMFRKNGGYLLNRDISPTSENPDKRLSSLSNTVELRLDFLFGKKQR